MIKKRQIFSKLLEELENNKILLLVGPRQVGKTTLLKQLREEVKDKKTFYLNVEVEEDKEILNQSPENIFNLSQIDKTEQQIIFIDEIQLLNNPSNFLKHLYDLYNENLKLVVSGSSSFYIDKKFKDSLMGRKRMFEILTLNFEEFLDFKDETDLKKYLFEKKNIPLGNSKRQLENLFLEYVTYGGYPEVILTKDKKDKIELLKFLSNDYIKKDIYEVNIEMSVKFFKLLKILANQVGELVNVKELSRSLEIDVRTIEKYLYIMQKSYCIGLIRPFWSNIRAELTRRPKVFFFDLGLRNAILNEFKNINDRFDKGQYFENILGKIII